MKEIKIWYQQLMLRLKPWFNRMVIWWKSFSGETRLRWMDLRKDYRSGKLSEEI